MKTPDTEQEGRPNSQRKGGPPGGYHTGGGLLGDRRGEPALNPTGQVWRVIRFAERRPKSFPNRVFIHWAVPPGSTAAFRVRDKCATWLPAWTRVGLEPPHRRAGPGSNGEQWRAAARGVGDEQRGVSQRRPGL